MKGQRLLYEASDFPTFQNRMVMVMNPNYSDEITAMTGNRFQIVEVGR